jgi:acetyl esterase
MHAHFLSRRRPTETIGRSGTSKMSMASKRRDAPIAAFLLSMPFASAALLNGKLNDIEFARAASIPLYMDAVIPDGPGPFPAAIVVHGGGWVRGDRRTDVAPLFPPLEQARIAWFSIDYRLSTDVMQFGSAVADVESAISFVKVHAAEYRIDPDRLALIGESAGGQLAAMAALKTPGVKAVVGLYTPTDLVALATNSAFVPQQIRESLRGTPFENLLLARLRQLSPIDNISVGAPPFLLIHGTADSLVPFSQSSAMCNRLKALGTACELYPVEGAGHGMRWWASSLYKVKMIRWLQEQLNA